jgi:hypothetical protein
MTTTRGTGKFSFLLLGVGLLLHAVCAEEAGTPGPTTSVVIKQAQDLDTKGEPVPGQRAELYIDNALKGQTTSPNADEG